MDSNFLSSLKTSVSNGYHSAATALDLLWQHAEAEIATLTNPNTPPVVEPVPPVEAVVEPVAAPVADLVPPVIDQAAIDAHNVAVNAARQALADAEAKLT